MVSTDKDELYLVIAKVGSCLGLLIITEVVGVLPIVSYFV